MHIRVGLPLPNDCRPVDQCRESIKNLVQAFPEHRFEVIEIHGSMIANNRIQIVDYNEMQFEKLLFVDGDISFAPEHFKILLETNLRVVSGVYKLRENAPSYWNYTKDYEKYRPWDKNDVIPTVECSGCGFMLVDQDVFALMRRVRNLAYFYYPWCREKGVYLTEDVGFSWACAKIGCPVRVHTRVNVWHWIKDTIPNGDEYAAL